MISPSFALSSVESNPSDSSTASIDSAGGCDENEESVDIAVSMHPAPDSAAARYVAAPIPEVACVCTWIGMDGMASRRADTSSRAAPGVRIPAMSFMQMESAPRFSSALASSTYFATVCTGDTV